MMFTFKRFIYTQPCGRQRKVVCHPLSGCSLVWTRWQVVIGTPNGWRFTVGLPFERPSRVVINSIETRYAIGCFSLRIVRHKEL